MLNQYSCNRENRNLYEQINNLFFYTYLFIASSRSLQPLLYNVKFKLINV